MSLIVSVQVTESSTHIVQIHDLVITNVGLVHPSDNNGNTPYVATVDGETQADYIYHNRDDGALALIELVLANHRKAKFYE